MTSRKGADRLPDSAFFSCIIPQPRRNCNGGAVFFFTGTPTPAKSFTDAKQNRRFCRLKNRETSVILVYESAVYITAGGLHLSGLTSGRRTFLLCPRRSTAKGVMSMTLLEILALLTLLATVGFGTFDIAYKIFHNKK